MGQIAHQDRGFVVVPKIIEIIVVRIHIDTNTAPTATRLPPVLSIRNIKKLINAKNTSQRNHCLMKIFGMGFFKLNLDSPISRNAPLGHKFQHQ